MRLKVHPKSREAALEFLKVFKVPGKDRVKVKVAWWWIQYPEPLSSGITERYTMTVAQYRMWRSYDS